MATNRLKQILDTKILIKGSSIPSQEPTVPSDPDHLSGNWVSTDIYRKEMFVNCYDERMFIRMDDGIRQICVVPDGTTEGNLLVFSGGTMVNIPSGTPGQTLTIGGDGYPTWA